MILVRREKDLIGTSRPVARIDFGEVQDPQKWTFWTQKVDFLTLPPSLNPHTKTQFLAHFVAKSGPIGRFGVVRNTPSMRFTTVSSGMARRGKVADQPP